MSFEIPIDLIHQLQLSLRKQANISKYNDPIDDDNDATSSTSISELDPSPPNLRCNSCNARLLRGQQSVICVFCGKQLPSQIDDFTPTITFNSTLGCKWLLHSLNLDGSETIETSFESPEPSGIEESVLSDLLDLRIKWIERPEVDEFDVRATTDDALFQKSTLNLGGAVKDDYVIVAKEESAFPLKTEQVPTNEGSDFQVHESINLFESVKPLETSGTSIQGEDSDFQVRESINLFENVKPLETLGTSTQDESHDSFSAWDAEFQSSDSKNVHEESKTGGDFAGPSVDLSAHMDSIFGSVNGKIDTVSSSSNTNDWFHDDLLWSSSSKVGNQTKQFEETTDSKDSGKMEISGNIVSHDSWGDFTFSTGAKDSSNSDKPPNEKEIEFEDASSDTWNEFTDSSNPAVAQVKIDSEEKPPNEREIEFEDDSSDAWNDFAVSTSAIDTSNQAVTQVKIEGNESSDKILNEDSFTQDPSSNEIANHTSSSNDTSDHKTEYDTFDSWNDFTSSTVANSDNPNKQTVNHANEELESKITDQYGDSSDVWNNFSSSTVTRETHGLAKETPGQLVADPEISNQEDDDPYDGWNVFTNSTSSQLPSNGSSKQSMEAIFESGKAKDDTVTSSSDAKQIEVPVLMENKRISSSAGIDLVQHNNEWQSSNNRESFDAWGDFTSSKPAQEPLPGSEPPDNSGVDIKDDSEDIWNDFMATTSVGDSSNKEITPISSGNKTISVDSDLFDNWNDFHSSSGTQDPSNETVNHITSTCEKPDKKTTDEKYDPLGVWNFSMSSISKNDPSKVSAKQTVNNETQVSQSQDEDDFGDWNDFTSSVVAKSPNGFPGQIVNDSTSGNKAPDNKSKTTDQDDTFDDWNDFMSSTDAKDPSKVLEKQTVNNVTSSNETRQDDDAWNAFTSSTDAKDPFKVDPAVNFVTSSAGTLDSKTIGPVDDSFGTWNDFVSSPGMEEPKGSAKDSISRPSQISNQKNDSFGYWSHFMGLTNTNDPSNSSIKPTVKQEYDEDTLDTWNDFVSSPGVPEPYSSATDTLSRLTGSNNSQTSIKQDHDPFHAWNNLNSFTKPGNPSDSSSHQTIDKMNPSSEAPNKATDQDEDDDAFGDWNDFQSSTTAEDPIEFSSKPSIFSGESKNQTNEVNFTQPMASVSNRTDDPVDGGGNADPAPKSEDPTTGSKPDNVDIFHDLSFMLQSNFYKPSKTGQFSSSKE
ncbi:hypothetical protein ACFE04_017170 [Oxalis oulophora]